MTNRITIKNSVKIIDNSYVIKEKRKSLLDTYNYLLSRNFNFFPEVIKEDNNYIYYKYINDITEPREQKILDLINILIVLHSKTTYYKEVDLDYYKYLYETISNKIDDTSKYYENLIANIDSEEYMSPSNYLIARNISMIFSALNYSKRNIDEWYKLIKDSRKVRLVTIHNNLSLDHYLKEDKPYLISWDNSKEDIPIFDLVSLYKNNYLDFEFTDLLKIYLNKYPLSDEEMLLFLTIIAIPDKIRAMPSEYKTVLEVRRLLDYLYKTSILGKEYRIKQKTDK